MKSFIINRKSEIIKYLLVIISFFLWLDHPFCQGQVIELNNPSFEDIPRPASVPSGWFDCGQIRFPRESPPDTQPSGAWDVFKPAFNGRTYLGMVVRNNDSWESVSQRLAGTLKKGKSYSFSIYLCSSDVYKSATSENLLQRSNYVTPAKLNIWGGNEYCEKAILLSATSPITNNDWKKFDFVFKPTRNVTVITLEAYYDTPVLMPYNGNILLDNASSIKEIIPPKPPKNIPVTRAKEEGTIASLKTKVKAGQTIKIDELYFQADTSNIAPSSFKVLDEVYKFLIKNKNVVIEIGGHTNGVPSDRYCMLLSTARAREVAEYLIKKGIPKSQVKFKGYGKSKPIASDKTAAGRKKNQRVEIKILSI